MESIAPVAAAPSPPAPAIPAAVEADLNAAQEAEHAAEAATAESTVADNDATGPEEDEGNAVGESQAISGIHESGLEGAESVSNPIHIPVASTNEAEDDDDDDDEDDVDLVYTEDDDDEDEEDDEDEDDEDDAIADITGARQAREFKGKSKKHSTGRKHTRKSRTRATSPSLKAVV